MDGDTYAVIPWRGNEWDNLKAECAWETESGLLRDVEGVGTGGGTGGGTGRFWRVPRGA